MADPLNQRIQFTPEITSVPAFVSLSLNDSDNAVWAIYQAAKSEAITHIGIRHTSTTGTSPTYKASIQGVGATGTPDGTIKGGGSPASVTFSPSSLGWGANVFTWLALDNSWTPLRGEEFSLYVTYDSGTVNASNFSSLTYYSNMPGSGRPYSGDFQTANTKRDGTPMLAYRTASGRYGLPVQSTGNVAFQLSSSPNEYGLKFTLPAWGSTYKIAGIRMLASLASSGTYSAYLYDGGGAADTTVLQSFASADSDLSAAGNRLQTILFSDTTLATLTFGNTYRVSLKADSAHNQALYYVDNAEADDFAAWPLGTNACWTYRSGGNWTDLTTRRPYGELILDDFTAASGSGGGFRSVNIRGGADQ